MKTLFTLFFALFISLSFAQNTDDNAEQNPGSKLKFGGYGQIDYNQALINNTKANGKLDIHRVVLFMGYSFSPKHR